MNEIEILNALGNRAAKEQVPAVDVTQSVMMELRTCSEAPDREWTWIAGLASVPATYAAVVAFYTVDGWMDPFQAFLIGLTWMIS